MAIVSSLVDPSKVGQFDQVLNLCLTEFENCYLEGNDIHALAAKLLKENDTTLVKTKELIKNYITARIVAKRPFDKKSNSALFKAVSEGNAQLVAIFGGQGNTDDYFEELRDLYQTYHVLVGDLIKFSADTLSELIRTTLDAEKVFTQGLNILEWLETPSNTPDKDYLLSIPISCPLIGVIQLAHYVVTAKLLGFTPGELRSYLKGATGHSQGLVTAVAIAETDSWDSFFCLRKKGHHCIILYRCPLLRSISKHFLATIYLGGLFGKQ